MPFHIWIANLVSLHLGLVGMCVFESLVTVCDFFGLELLCSTSYGKYFWLVCVVWNECLLVWI